MFSIYHFFAYLLHNRRRLQFVPNLTDFPFPSDPLSFRGKGGFPTLALRFNPGGDPPGGELLGLKDSSSYSISTFQSHIPAGAISIDSLGNEKANEIYESMNAAGEDAKSMPIREVFYLIRGQRQCYTKLCLIHGNFFETANTEEVVQFVLGQVFADCLIEDERSIRPEHLDSLSRALAHEVLSNQYRSVKNASVAFRLQVEADVIEKTNILNPDYFPAIRDDTISFIIPYSMDIDFRQRRRYLKSLLTQEEWTAGRKMVITHPFNGDFFVLSYAL